MFCVVCFDIVDDKVRNKVAKILKGVGYRVQKSVFECPDISEEQFLKIKDKIESLIDFTQDSIRYYRQCKRCLENFEFSGIGSEPQKNEYGVV